MGVCLWVSNGLELDRLVYLFFTFSLLKEIENTKRESMAQNDQKMDRSASGQISEFSL